MKTDILQCLLIIIYLIQSFSSQYNFRVTENQPPNTFVGKVLIKDGYVYDFPHKEERFMFDKQSGTIYTTKVIDRESLSSNLIELFLYKKTMEGQFLQTISIKIEIIDENDNPPIFYPDKLERRVVENIALFSDISLVVAKDADTEEFGVSNNYKIESGNEEERFALSDVGVQYRGQLLLKVVKPLDREIRDKYSLIISVQDKGRPPFKGFLQVNVTVEDYNDNSPVFSPSKYNVRVNESNLPGYEVVRVFATDADIGLNKKIGYKFKKTKSTIENEFSIDSETGSIKLIKSVTCHLIQRDCTLIIEAFDHGSPSLSAYCYVAIHVIRINAFFPRLKISYVNSVDRTAYIEIGKITRKPLAIVYSQDYDQDPRDPITVSITSGNEDNLFNLEKTHGNVYIFRQVKKITNINIQKYTIFVQAVDSGSPAKETTEKIIIKVNKANIYYPIFEDGKQSVVISRNLSINSFVANFQATDKDPGPNGKISFVITRGNLDNSFGISKESGLVTLQKPIWFIKETEIVLTIVARDSGINRLETAAHLHVSIIQTNQLEVRFSSSCNKRFIPTIEDIPRQSLDNIFLYDFRSQLKISDPTRQNELEFVLINHVSTVTDFVLSRNGSFYMNTNCQVARLDRFFVAIVHNLTLMDKIEISVEMTVAMVNLLCRHTPVTYLIKLPQLFEYNKLLGDISSVYERPADGKFSLNLSHGFYVTRKGLIYWRSAVSGTALFTLLDIQYSYLHVGRTLIDTIYLFMYRNNSDRILFDCQHLEDIINHNQSKSIQLKDLLVDEVTNAQFLLLSPFSTRNFKIVDNILFVSGLFYSTSVAPKEFSLLIHSSKELQFCNIKFTKHTRFSNDKFFFQVYEHNPGTEIGMVRIDGELNSIRVSITGKNSQYFYYNTQTMTLYLRQTFPTETKPKIIQVQLEMIDLFTKKIISTANIVTEIFSPFFSPIFSEPFYQFIIPENSSSHTPLNKISVINSQQITDFYLTVTEESVPGKWSVFPDGALFLLSELDFEERKSFHLTILASNRVDKNKYSRVSVTVFVEDCNDNFPRFTASSYHFEIPRNIAPSSNIGRVFAMDSDSGLNGYLNYMIINLSSDLDFLEINSETGMLTTNSFVDTTENRVQLQVFVFDHGSPSHNSTTKIFLKINSSPLSSIIIKVPINFVNISENALIGQEVIRIQAISKARLTYRITKCTHKGIFSIDEATGVISVSSLLDRELIRSYILTVVAMNSINLNLSDHYAVTNVRITVLDYNDNSPIFVTESPKSLVVSELTRTGHVIAKYFAEDADEGLNGAVRYQISGTSSDVNTVFKIDHVSGIVYLNQPVDYEYKTRWSVIITASDMGDPQRHTNFAVEISVNNRNDNKPKFGDDFQIYFFVRQMSSIGTTVGRVYASDADKNDIIYSLGFIEPNDHPFSINSKSGIISISKPIPEEESYFGTVMAIDADRRDWFAIQSLRIEVKREKEGEIQLMTYGAILLPKSVFFGDKIATIEAELYPKYRNSRLIYSLVNCSFDKLVINRFSGDIFIESDHPVFFRSIDLTFVVLLESHQSKSIIKYHSTKLILDHGENHNLNFQNNEYMLQISECQALPGLDLIQLKALYPSNPICDLQYFITNIFMGISNRIKLPNSIIHLNKDTGWLSIGQDYLDMEQIESGQITVEIVVVDRGRNYSRIRSTNVFINVIDCNDNKPVFSNETFIFRVPENSSVSQKVYVGTVTATDKDIESILTYSWYEDQSHFFDLNKESGIITTTGEPLNYEQNSSFYLRVQVSDGVFEAVANVLIIVEDVNDVCHQFSSDRFDFVIQENVPIQTIIGQVKMLNNDKEKSAKIKFAIISEWGQHLFFINPDHGIITTLGKIDYEQETHYILLITATDISEQSLILSCLETVTTTVLVSITDVNDNEPVFDTSKLYVSVPENISVGTSISQLSASDGDKQNVLLFEIASPNDGIFAVNPLTGAIFTVSSLDYEKCEKHVVTVICSDGVHSVLADVEVTVINTNDEIPVIHNRERITLSAVNKRQQSISIKCSDRDNLGPLTYDLVGPPDILVNQLTGTITLNPQIYLGHSTELILICSDQLHRTEKNVTLIIQDKTISSKQLSLEIILDNYSPSSSKIEDYLNKSFVLQDKYNLFLASPSNESLNRDWNYFRINTSIGQLNEVKGFTPRKSQYRISVIAIPLDSKDKHLKIFVSINYKKFDLCHPSFIGTPYSFHVRRPVTTSKLLGMVSVGYCDSHTITYYLSSGHSFFFVNDTNGEIFVIKDPPTGRFRFKLSAMIHSTSKIFLSSFVTVTTTESGLNPTKCLFNVSRIIVKRNSRSDESIGQISIQNMGSNSRNVSYLISPNWPLSISQEGQLFLSSQYFNYHQAPLNLSTHITWWDQNRLESLTCPVQIIMVAPVFGCTLSIVYEGPFLEIRTFADAEAGKFIFGIPVAHNDCQLSRRSVKYYLDDLNIRINETSGELSSRNVLNQQLYKMSVKITSSFAKAELIVPIHLYVLNIFNDVEITFQTHQSVVLQKGAQVGSTVISVRATITSKYLPTDLKYSLVYYCCVYPTDIGIYDDSIYQSLFHVSRDTGDIIINKELPQSLESYNLRVRASLETKIPSRYIFKDMDVNIILEDLECSCGHVGYFSGSIEENSDHGSVIVRNVLKCYRKRQLNIKFTPQWIEEFVYYDQNSNEIKTNIKSFDREKQEFVELTMDISDDRGKIIKSCQGIITVIDVNDNSPMFMLNYFMGSVFENAPIGTWILDIGVVDADSKLFPLKFTLLGEEASAFYINPQNGSVYLSQPVDREQRTKYELKAAVFDGINGLEIGMLITVKDVNDNCPIISPEITNRTFVINNSEFLNGKVLVAKISAVDHDDPASNNSKIQYFIPMESSRIPIQSLFFLDEDSGSLFIIPEILHWVYDNETVDILIRATDRGNPALSNTSVIHILFIGKEYEMKISKEVYDSPVAVLYTTTEGSRIGSVSIDFSEDFRDIIYQIVNGNGSSTFSVGSVTGHIVASKNINSIPLGTWLQLIVQACGYRKSLTYLFCSKKESVVIVISDFNLYSPQIRTGQTIVNIPETAKIGTNLLSLDVIDQDIGLAGMTKVTLKSTLNGEFSLVPQSTYKSSYSLILSGSLDYERQQRYTIVIVTHDLGVPRRSQMFTLLINVLDEDDNAPYFAFPNFIAHVTLIQDEVIELPPAMDDDSGLNLKDPIFMLMTNNSISFQLAQKKNKSFIKITKPSINESITTLSLQISGAAPQNYPESLPPGRYSQIFIYLVLSPKLFSYPPKCSYNSINSNHHFEFAPSVFYPLTSVSKLSYHLLASQPRLPEQEIMLDQATGHLSLKKAHNQIKLLTVSVSNSIEPSHDYRICQVIIDSSSSGKPQPFKILLKNIVINRNIKAAVVVGKVLISADSEDAFNNINFRLYSSHYLPFVIRDSGEIVAVTDIYSNYPVVFNVTIRAQLRSQPVQRVMEKFFISVQTDHLRYNVIPLSIHVRESIGEGAIIGSMNSLLRNYSETRGSYKLLRDTVESDERLLVDRLGVIRLKRSISREGSESIRKFFFVEFADKTDKIDLLVMVIGENNFASKPRNADIVFSVTDKSPRLTKLVRLLPGDNDTAGNYKCRLDTLDTPQGVLVTPDCWLYIFNISSIPKWKNNSLIRVVHHDGLHKAVKSSFHLKISVLTLESFNENFIILKLDCLLVGSVIRNIKLVRNLIRSFQIHVPLIGIDQRNGYIVIWSSSAGQKKLIEFSEFHRSQFETALKCKIEKIITDLCDQTSCNFHGSCLTRITINNDNLLTDESRNHSPEINVYSSVEIDKRCICHDGYIGKRCNLFAKCNQQICHNGGICAVDKYGQIECDCPSGYEGPNCEQDINECEQNDVCNSNGKCINTMGSFRCECNLNWIGNSVCSKPIDHCLSNPCSISGTDQCISTLDGYKCRCLFGNYGQKCEQSAISLNVDSSQDIELSHLSKFSLEFSSISKEAPIATLFVSSIAIQISLSLGRIRLTVFKDSLPTSQQASNSFVATGKWYQLDVLVGSINVSLSIKPCGDLNSCDSTNELFEKQFYQSTSLSLPYNRIDLGNRVRLVIGSNKKVPLPGHQNFIGCIRNLQLPSTTIIKKEENNLVYDSCPRYKNGSTPCSNPDHTCSSVGKCIDEWFTARCECPSGYQPPSCSPGYSAFSISPNTIISFVRRPQPLFNQHSLKKRSIILDTSTISLRIKTQDMNSFVLMSFSEFHSYTLVQLENGFVKVVDKYAQSTQEMLHKAVSVSDNKVHSISITRHSSGTVSLTVDYIVAQVNWLQSHNIFGPSVHTIYLAGLLENQRLENSLSIPNFSGCLSDVRFNNESMPLSGLTELFNVSILQGSFYSGCSSDVCLQSGLCEKYQKCQEVKDIPHSVWGQYICVDDNKFRLLTIIIPVILSIVCVALVAFLVYWMKRRARKAKAKDITSHSTTELQPLKKSKSIDITGTTQKFGSGQMKKSEKTPRSMKTSSFLMQKKGNISHPDLIRSHEIMTKSNLESIYYQDPLISNPYMSSRTLTIQPIYGSKNVHCPVNAEPLSAKNLKKFNFSTGTLKEPDDSIVYQCSHPDDYEAVGSHQSSNTSQDHVDQPKYPFAYQFQTQGIKPSYFGHKQREFRQSSSSSSNNSHFLIGQPQKVIFPDNRRIDDVFSNTDSNMTTSPQAGVSLDSLSSSTQSQNVFTPTNSSDSIPSHKNSIIPNSSSCWNNIQRALPPPPPAEDQYEYADVKPN